MSATSIMCICSIDSESYCPVCSCYVMQVNGAVLGKKIICKPQSGFSASTIPIGSFRYLNLFLNCFEKSWGILWFLVDKNLS